MKTMKKFAALMMLLCALMIVCLLLPCGALAGYNPLTVWTDGRGVAAAFMLGAQGVQVGTRFLVADECTVAEPYKELVLKAKDISTRATGRSTGHPVRALKTRFTNEYAKLEAEGADPDKLAEFGTGALRRAAKDGDVERGSFLCGQVAGMVRERQSAADIVDDLVSDGEKVLGKAGAWVR